MAQVNAGRHILITGASSGIGTACAAYLETRGYSIVAGVRRTEDGERLAAASSGRTSWVHLDVTEPSSILAAVESVRERVTDEGLHGLVNNAGIAVAGPMEAVPLESLRRQFDVNVFGPVEVIQAFAPLLIRARGRIVNVSSVSGKSVVPLLGPYAGSKYALEAISDALRMELADVGVHVCVIEPGVVNTPIWDKSTSDVGARLESLPDSTRARYQPLVDGVKAATEKSRRRAGPVERVARAVFHALHARRPRTRYVVGHDAWLMLKLVNRLPDRVRDWIIRRALGV